MNHTFEGPVQQLGDLILTVASRAMFLKGTKKVAQTKNAIKLAMFRVNGSNLGKEIANGTTSRADSQTKVSLLFLCIAHGAYKPTF